MGGSYKRGVDEVDEGPNSSDELASCPNIVSVVEGAVHSQIKS